MEQNGVSIILPAYNAEKFLAETLDSILKQSYNNYEIIIINDGSTDHTQQIIDEYEERFPEIINSYIQENQGQSATRNKALKYAKGKYIAFIDSDDCMAENYLLRLHGAGEEANADIVICGYQKFINETGEVTLVRNPKDWEVAFKHGIKHVFQYSPWAKIFRADLLMKHQIQFSVNEQLEDGPYCVMTDLLAERVVIVDFIGYNYRIHQNSIMGNVRKKQARPRLPYKGIEAAINKVRAYRPDQQMDQVLEYCIIKILAGLATNMCKTCDNETRKAICNYCYCLIGEYFPNINKNPYIRVSALPKLPFVHRAAVRLFVFAYRGKVLYPFSLLVSKFL